MRIDRFGKGITRLSPLELCQNVHATDNTTENGMIAIQVSRGHKRQVELRSARIASGVRHCETAPKVQPLVLTTAFARNPIPRIARAVAIGTTGLSHETMDDSVELKSVVETLLDEPDEVGHGVWELILKQLLFDFSLAGL